ncbi:ATP-grasp domain-containing protein [Bacillus cereus]|nr:ATP-grasp domain-containing protein [Bacillus cereus]
MKENILIINNIEYHNYFKQGDIQNPIINPNKYNIFIFSDPRIKNTIPANLYNKLISIDFNDYELLLNQVKKIHSINPINHVITLKESTILLGSIIRENLKIDNGLGINAANIFRDKFLMKKTVERNSIKCPNFSKIQNYNELMYFFQSYKKIVIKPRLGMGSQNTYIVSDKDSLDIAYKKIQHQLNDYIVEEFIAGDMYHIDSIVKNGEIKLVSISKYLNSTLSYNNNSTLSSVMINKDALYNRLKHYNEAILNIMDYKNGISHLEIFVNNHNEIIFCEIAARSGGAGVVPSIEKAFSINLYEAAICLELDNPLPKIISNSLFYGWIIFFKKNGTVKNIKTEVLKQDWICDYEIAVTPGEHTDVSKYSTDAAVSIILSGESEETLTEHINWLTKNFVIDYE